MQLGITTRTYGDGDQSWLGSRDGTDVPQTCTIATSTLTAGTHFPDGYIPSGTPLARFTSGGNAGRYTVLNNAASDGSQTLVGYLLTDQPVRDAAAPLVASYIYRGRIRIPRLPSFAQSLITSGVQSGNPRFIYTTIA
ncbi:hypothetical protein KIH74_22950 [Kineosporia sp. J2-2]|uniref:Uncharacterized protein n=1 Tax=Kineosporia corallincola TaxID=2835133 RepID=A0ABS5TLU3_9ACTN|nr:hypothetical protein [Kineosporia corallincola]MBT0771818.1 hypothetical protein [Kineosporia corallincola]